MISSKVSIVLYSYVTCQILVIKTLFKLTLISFFTSRGGVLTTKKQTDLNLILIKLTDGFCTFSSQLDSSSRFLCRQFQ